jgi:hypothetical protein
LSHEKVAGRGKAWKTEQEEDSGRECESCTQNCHMRKWQDVAKRGRQSKKKTAEESARVALRIVT